MFFNVLADATRPYSRLESFVYDSFISPAMGAFYENVLAEIPDTMPEGSEILDVGCGGGQLIRFLAEKRPRYRFYGIDLSAQQVKRASKRLAPFEGRAFVQEASAMSLPFPKGKFDMVLSMGSIKHWPDKRKGLSECLRVTKPGGRVAVSEADRGCQLEDIDLLFDGTLLPGFMRYPFRAFFLLHVAGPSMDLEDARLLCKDLPFETVTVSRAARTPGFLIDGTAPAPS